MGSGDFLQSTEAEDVMSDTSSGGRWLHFNLSGGGDSLVILDDGDRKAPQHLKNLDIHNKVRVELNNTHIVQKLVLASQMPQRNMNITNPTGADSQESAGRAGQLGGSELGIGRASNYQGRGKPQPRPKGQDLLCVGPFEGQEEAKGC